MTSDILLSYYGDDFTGSTDVMEALTTGGVETVLFTAIPSEDHLSTFGHCKAVGIAGHSRSQPPAEMEATLRPALSWLKKLNARFCHYKICSTFDSAPDKGSIGKALETGLSVFGQKRSALVVGAPQLKRWTYFGSLFAGYQQSVFRIDEHPVMSCHPATPMTEANLVKHLAHQTNLPIACYTPCVLAKPQGQNSIPHTVPQNATLLLDVFDVRSQQTVGDILDRDRQSLGPFLVGSSGIEYALLHAWQSGGLTTPPPAPVPLAPAKRISVVSGSCSPTTGRQIDHALDSGFTGIKVDHSTLASGIGIEDEFENALNQASEVLQQGASPLIYTAKGSADSAAPSNDLSHDQDRVGRTLGRLLANLTQKHALERVAVAGGDTSSHALNELGVFALTLRKAIPETPGSPVCTAHRTGQPDLEIALKGGQVGDDGYFVKLRDGTFS